MVLFEVTPRIRSALDFVLLHCRNDVDEKAIAQFEKARSGSTDAPGISLNCLQLLSKTLKSEDHKQKEQGGQSKVEFKWVHELLEDSKIVIPEDPSVRKKTSDPAKEARLAKLRAQLEHKRYEKMVENVDFEKTYREQVRDSREIKSFNTSMSIGINVIVTAVTVFAIAWYLFNRSFGPVVGVLAGTLCAAVALTVEVLLFVIRGSEVDAQTDSHGNFIPKNPRKPFRHTQPVILQQIVAGKVHAD